ncbi:unnamed protein product [Acanthoscelides obtectus]|uniref:DDE Tnp4 domain-containing protein n=1 Tax=Acanthoscelides obtectus TaxID=200917 RepID=A0A9P0LJ45_ACAOB|nr:unnamed protein product [Acanthoscelides obtectus]CAK1641035.1 hypothetical protein AOBTE_LOCUS12100 [Acanthoscelides obtectus]
MKLLKQDDAENLADSQNNSQTDDIIEEETNMEHSSITPESNKDDTQGPSISAREESPKIPSSGEEWLAVADKFIRLWNFPNCVGSMDGKHIILQSPKCSGSDDFSTTKAF